MGVCIRKVTCLSMDKTCENHYSLKACKGDIVTLYFSGSKMVQGRINDIKSNYLVLEDLNNGNKTTFLFNDIQGFIIEHRGSISKRYFP